MKGLRLVGLCFMLMVLVPLGFPANGLAAGVEQEKFIDILAVNATTGVVAVSVKQPAASTACLYNLLSLPENAHKDKVFSFLLAAKTANVQVSINFGDDCKVTSVSVQ